MIDIFLTCDICGAMERGQIATDFEGYPIGIVGRHFDVTDSESGLVRCPQHCRII